MRTLENWKQWKAKCALGLCDNDVRRELQGFVSVKFMHFVRIGMDWAGRQGSPGAAVSVAEAWHRFETHFRLHKSPDGKSFKVWLFARKNTRGYGIQEAVEAGATVLVRDVVREYLRKECPDLRMVSFSGGAGGSAPDGQVLSVEELLPCEADTARAVEERELDAMAREEAPGAFAQLNRKQRVALLAYQAGLSLIHPTAIKAAECSRTTLHASFRSALAGIAAAARARYAHEEMRMQALLACRMYEHVGRLAFAWGKSELGIDGFCNGIEGMG
jgi:hypothetical protein